MTQHDQLAQFKMSVLLVQTDPQSRESSKAWLDSHQINWPGGTLTDKVDVHLRDWLVSALPWPILTDMNQIRSMGFSLDQLAVALAAKDLSTLPLHTNWRFIFDALYRLQDSEILKRIAPPL